LLAVIAAAVFAGLLSMVAGREITTVQVNECFADVPLLLLLLLLCVQAC
jgi:hypothetical protein